MRAVLVAALLALLPAQGHAEDPSPVEPGGFPDLATRIGIDPSLAGQWFVLLPTIARQCEMVVDNERVMLMMNRLDHIEAVDDAADYFASHSGGRLRSAWDVFVSRDPDGACRFVDGLWGAGADRQVSILHDNAGTMGRAAHGPATDAGLH